MAFGNFASLMGGLLGRGGNGSPYAMPRPMAPTMGSSIGGMFGGGTGLGGLVPGGKVTAGMLRPHADPSTVMADPRAIAANPAGYAAKKAAAPAGSWLANAQPGMASGRPAGGGSPFSSPKRSQWARGY